MSRVHRIQGQKLIVQALRVLTTMPEYASLRAQSMYRRTALAILKGAEDARHALGGSPLVTVGDGMLTVKTSRSAWKHQGFLAFALGGLLLVATPAVAEPVGSAVVNGQIVILDSNGTWKYKDAKPPVEEPSCDKAGTVDLCITKLGWKAAAKRGDFVALYSFNGKYYFGIMSEPSGTDNGMSEAILRQAIIENAAQGSGTTANRIPVLATEEQVKGRAEFKSISYAVPSNGGASPLVFHNVYRVYRDKSVQFVFWGAGKAMSKDFSTAINSAIEQIKFD